MITIHISGFLAFCAVTIVGVLMGTLFTALFFFGAGNKVWKYTIPSGIFFSWLIHLTMNGIIIWT
ncbi:MAG: hypothetical protein WC679_02170 [Bacteroidales bacterium]|jgi:hypothetical protein